MTVYLFNSNGDWIAFRRSESDRYLWGSDSRWLGWFPWGDEHAVGTSGNYLGSVVRGNRLLAKLSPPSRANPAQPSSPAQPASPSSPASRAAIPMPSGFGDIPPAKLRK
ncbi:hypothetical protein GCM10009662_52470 [Catellatospora coxensis]|uniref:4-fold beta flower domain-containing protein n=1 Tax=Catellatospora coxensis TaxID=310354 RepID=A0A8J3KYY4_9ACTN|nr:hypothetical protein Cco03nite_82470 [Catellatospora coxensis]